MLRSEYETDTQFSVQELTEMYKKFENLGNYRKMSADTSNEIPKFELWLADRGTELNYKVPAYKYIFNVPLDDRTIDNYVTALTQKRADWDWHVESTEYVKPLPPFTICRQKNRSQGFREPQRDFLVKEFIFPGENCQYVYSSAVVSSKQGVNYPPQKDVIRGTLIYRFYKVEKKEKHMSITVLLQIDNQFQGTAVTVQKFKMKKYIEDNYNAFLITARKIKREQDELKLKSQPKLTKEDLGQGAANAEDLKKQRMEAAAKEKENRDKAQQVAYAAFFGLEDVSFDILTKAIKGTKTQRVEQRHQKKEEADFSIPEEMLKDPDFQFALVRFYGSEDIFSFKLSEDLKYEEGAKKLIKVQLTPEKIEEQKKKREAANAQAAKAKQLKQLDAYRAFYQTPDIKYETLEKAYKGVKKDRVATRQEEKAKRTEKFNPPKEMLDDPEFMASVINFYGDLRYAKMMFNVQKQKLTDKGKFEKKTLTPEQIEEKKKLRAQMEASAQKEKDLKYLQGYRIFFCCPDADFPTLQAAYKGIKLERKQERQKPMKEWNVEVPAKYLNNKEFQADMQTFYGTEDIAISVNSKGPALPPSMKKPDPKLTPKLEQKEGQKPETKKNGFQIKPMPKGTAADSDLHKNPPATLRPKKNEEKEVLMTPDGRPYEEVRKERLAKSKQEAEDRNKHFIEAYDQFYNTKTTNVSQIKEAYRKGKTLRIEDRQKTIDKKYQIPQEMLEDDGFQFAMMKFFGSEHMAKAMLSQDFKQRPDGKLKKVEMKQEDADKAREERLKQNQIKQKERDLKYLYAYRAFFVAPEATYQHVKMAFKGEKKTRVEKRVEKPPQIEIKVPESMLKSPDFYDDAIRFFGNENMAKAVLAQNWKDMTPSGKNLKEEIYGKKADLQQGASNAADLQKQRMEFNKQDEEKRNNAYKKAYQEFFCVDNVDLAQIQKAYKNSKDSRKHLRKEPVKEDPKKFEIPQDMLNDPDFLHAAARFFGSADIAKFVLSQDFKVRPDGKLKKVEITDEKRNQLKQQRMKQNDQKDQERKLKMLNTYKAFFCAPNATLDNLKSALDKEKKTRKAQRANPPKIKLGSIPQHMKEDKEFYYDTLLFFGNRRLAKGFLKEEFDEMEQFHAKRRNALKDSKPAPKQEQKPVQKTEVVPQAVPGPKATTTGFKEEKEAKKKAMEMGVTFNTNLDDVEVKEGEKSIATDELTDLNNISGDDQPYGQRASPSKEQQKPVQQPVKKVEAPLPKVKEIAPLSRVPMSTTPDMNEQMKQMMELKEIVMQQQKMIEEMKKNENKSQKQISKLANSLKQHGVPLPDPTSTHGSGFYQPERGSDFWKEEDTGFYQQSSGKNSRQQQERQKVVEHQKKIDQIIGKAKNQVREGHAQRLGASQNSEFDGAKQSIGSMKAGGAKGQSGYLSPGKNLPEINHGESIGSRANDPHYQSNTSVLEERKRKVPYPASQQKKYGVSQPPRMQGMQVRGVAGANFGERKKAGISDVPQITTKLEALRFKLGLQERNIKLLKQQEEINKEMDRRNKFSSMHNYNRLHKDIQKTTRQLQNELTSYKNKGIEIDPDLVEQCMVLFDEAEQMVEDFERSRPGMGQVYQRPKYQNVQSKINSGIGGQKHRFMGGSVRRTEEDDSDRATGQEQYRATNKGTGQRTQDSTTFNQYEQQQFEVEGKRRF